MRRAKHVHDFGHVVSELMSILNVNVLATNPFADSPCCTTISYCMAVL